MLLPLSIAALWASLLSPAPGSEPIVPLSVEFSNSSNENGEAKICELTAELTNSESPERVTISAFGGYDKLEGAMFVGLLAGAANPSASGDFEAVSVTSAALISDSFNSADELDHDLPGVGDDGIFMAVTTDVKVASRFLKSIADGGYYLTLSGDDAEVTSWTYKVKKSPPAEVQQRFKKCLEELEPGAISLRASHLAARLGHRLSRQ